MGCNSSKVVETTDVQQNNPKKPVENESVRHEPMKDSDRGDKRKMLVGTKTKLQMEMSSMSAAILEPAQRLRARAIFSKLQSSDETLRLERVPDFLRLMFGKAWESADDEEKSSSLESFKKADKDGDGALTFVEVLKAIMRQIDGDFVSRAKAEFSKLDRDNDGYATVEEVTEHLKEQGIDVNAKNVQAFIQRFDKDKDGKIKLEEFVDEILVSPLANAVGASLTAAIERAFVEVEEDVALQDVRRELLEEFEMFAEGDRMSRANVERVLRAQGVDLTDEEMGEICTKAKVDDSGVDRDTWLFVAIQAFLKTRGGGIQGDSAFREAKRAFSIFDINDDGFVVASELEHILLQEVELGSSMAGDRKVEVTNLVKAMDMNGDGKVSLAEFVLFCMNSSTARVSRTGNAVDDRMEM